MITDGGVRGGTPKDLDARLTVSGLWRCKCDETHGSSQPLLRIDQGLSANNAAVLASSITHEFEQILDPTVPGRKHRSPPKRLAAIDLL